MRFAAAGECRIGEDHCMRILVLGGSWFLGRAFVESALAGGHQVTTFNRGRTGVDVVGAELVRGDRTVPEDVTALATHGPWDAVVDTSGMVPRTVLDTARALEDHVGRYAYVSTVNVYKGWPDEPLSEDSPVRPCAPDALDEGDDSGADRYGRLKAGCERAALEVFDNRGLVVRPGVILGPYEYVGRLEWWLRRMERGGRVLAPGDPGRHIQPVDVRDVAAFMLAGLTEGLNGVFNVTAPQGHATYGDLVTSCREVTGSDAEPVWVDDDFLTEHGVGMWTELPLWRTHRGVWRVDSQRAREAGLRCRPLSETVRDTWAWLGSGESPVASARKADIGLDAVKEHTLLAEWGRRHRSGGSA